MTPLARSLAALIVAAALATALRTASAAESKPAPVRTVGPAPALTEQQQSDLAAKRAATAAVPAPVEAAPARFSAGRRAPLTLPAMRIRRLPLVSEALGRIPREEWIRLALGKGPDVTVSLPAPAASANGAPR